MKQNNSQTKIIATLGPATSAKIIISELITSGVDVFRINFSHSSKEGYLNGFYFNKHQYYNYLDVIFLIL